MRELSYILSPRPRTDAVASLVPPITIADSRGRATRKRSALESERRTDTYIHTHVHTRERQKSSPFDGRGAWDKACMCCSCEPLLLASWKAVLRARASDFYLTMRSSVNTVNRKKEREREKEEKVQY